MDPTGDLACTHTEDVLNIHTFDAVVIIKIKSEESPSSPLQPGPLSDQDISTPPKTLWASFLLPSRAGDRILVQPWLSDDLRVQQVCGAGGWVGGAQRTEGSERSHCSLALPKFPASGQTLSGPNPQHYK